MIPLTSMFKIMPKLVNQKGIVAPIAIILLITFALAGVIIARNQSKGQPVNQPLVTNTPSPSTGSINKSSSPSASAKVPTVQTTAKPTPIPTPRSITLSGYAYEDRNNNGKFDADDIKLPIRDLHWYDTTKPAQKILFQTDSSGNFLITYSVLGNLGVEGYVWNNLTPINGTQVFSKNTDNIVIEFRSTNASEQVGAGVIEGDIFQDSNRNGSRDNGESGIYFYKLYLVDSGGGIRNTAEGTQTTDQGGHFKYTNLPYGTYKIQLLNPTGQYVIEKLETSITLSSTNSSVTNIQIPVFKQL